MIRNVSLKYMFLLLRERDNSWGYVLSYPELPFAIVGRSFDMHLVGADAESQLSLHTVPWARVTVC